MTHLSLRKLGSLAPGDFVSDHALRNIEKIYLVQTFFKTKHCIDRIGIIDQHVCWTNAHYIAVLANISNLIIVGLRVSDVTLARAFELDVVTVEGVFYTGFVMVRRPRLIA